jgi:hypothetical protein
MRIGGREPRARRAAGTVVLRRSLGGRTLPVSLILLFAAAGVGAQSAPPAAHASKRVKAPKAAAAAPAELPLEPKALDILKAASERLAAARTLRFTAVVSYENPSLFGPALVYTTKSDVVVERPDKLRIITSGDGPRSEFYDNGQQMMAFAPAENLVAIAPAPPTIDAALKTLYDSAATYYPFTDLIVADPYKDIADGLKLAFYIGQSNVVGGTTTDMLAYASDEVFVQAWIGTEDKLPRMLRAVYRADPAQLRHQMELSNWQLDLFVPPDAFVSSAAAKATRIDFARPDPQFPPPAKPAAKGRTRTQGKASNKP